VRFDTVLKYRLLEKLLLKEDGDELLAFDPSGLEVHQLNSSLATVARLCDGKNSCEQIVIEFATRFGLSIDDASREAYRAMVILHDRKLISPA
jgi:hypothetical protein